MNKFVTRFTPQNFVSLCLLLLHGLTCLSGCAPLPPEPRVQIPEPKPPRPVKIAIALGGGGARGFAHIGVIKALEAQGIQIDIVTGTSAGAVIGSVYASGLSGFQLQRMALDIDESILFDWSLLSRGGFIKGQALEEYINKQTRNRPIEEMKRSLGVVASDLLTGDKVVFRKGNVGMAVRASSAIPGVLNPVQKRDREYVDGGVSSPVPVLAAREMGADFVIAVDVSQKPKWRKKPDDTLDILFQTFTIMGNAISKQEMKQADVVISPHLADIDPSSIQDRNLAILKGEEAAAMVMAQIKEKLSMARQEQAGNQEKRS